MINGEKGISTIKLIFTIFILALVIAGIVFIVKRLWQDTSVKNIGTDLLYIKAKCKIIHDKNIIDPNEQLLGENITEYAENEEVNIIVSQSDKWYKLKQEDLETIGAGDLKSEDGYLVNYEEEDVIYAKGIIENEQTYYKLSDLTAAQEQKEKEAEEKEKEGSEQNPTEGEEQQSEEQTPKEETVAVEQPPVKELVAEAEAPEEVPVILDPPEEVPVTTEQTPEEVPAF